MVDIEGQRFIIFLKKNSKEEMMQIMKRELGKMRENGSNHVESFIV
jgi:hypothetical protein